MSYDDDLEYEEESLFNEYGEGFEADFDAVSEQKYEKAFDDALEQQNKKPGEFSEETEEEINEDDYEFDSVVGGRDKKPVMSMLNKGKLSKYEMDDLLNGL